MSFDFSKLRATQLIDSLPELIQEPQATVICNCGSAMLPAIEVCGWRNWDCLDCGRVQPLRILAQVSPERVDIGATPLPSPVSHKVCG